MGQQKTIFLSLILSFLSALLIFMFTRTLILRLFFSMSIFFITISVLAILFDIKVLFQLKLPSVLNLDRLPSLKSNLLQSRRVLLLNLLALLATIAVLFIPAINFNLGAIQSRR